MFFEQFESIFEITCITCADKEADEQDPPGHCRCEDRHKSRERTVHIFRRCRSPTTTDTHTKFRKSPPKFPNQNLVCTLHLSKIALSRNHHSQAICCARSWRSRCSNFPWREFPHGEFSPPRRHFHRRRFGGGGSGTDSRAAPDRSGDPAKQPETAHWYESIPIRNRRRKTLAGFSIFHLCLA